MLVFFELDYYMLSVIAETKYQLVSLINGPWSA